MNAAQTMAVQAQNITVAHAEIAALKTQVTQLKTQLDWFKRQLFGERSEKRLVIDPAIQADLLAGLGGAVAVMPKPAEKQKISYERNKPRARSTSRACASMTRCRWKRFIWVPRRNWRMCPRINKA